MAARDFELPTQLLVSEAFRTRDASGAWARELALLCEDTGASLTYFENDWDVHRLLSASGLLLAASESNVPNHAVAHDIFRHAPESYLKATVQHGFECIGFRHGRGHTKVAGSTASFAADLLCTWYDLPKLTAMAASQAPKVLVTGPTAALQAYPGEFPKAGPLGLVCENLHSVRFGMQDKLEGEFLKSFRRFALDMGGRGAAVRLRPHPAGQYSAKAKALLPRNIHLENAPMYRIDLRRFAYGISPPSSVVIDLLLARTPVAIWQDKGRLIDSSNFDGLPKVSTAEEMIAFATAAVRNRARLAADQRKWLESQGMPLDPLDVYDRYAKLFEAAIKANEQRISPSCVAPRRELLQGPPRGLSASQRGASQPEPSHP
jgi:hypothetical protein